MADKLKKISRDPLRLIKPYNAEIGFINHGDQMVCLIRNHHKCLNEPHPFHLHTYVMGLLSLDICYFYRIHVTSAHGDLGPVTSVHFGDLGPVTSGHFFSLGPAC